MTIDPIRTKAERALRLHNNASPHIKAREQCQLLGELARYVLSEHLEDDGELIGYDDALAFNVPGHQTVAFQAVELVRRTGDDGYWLCINGAGAVVSVKTRGELRRLLAALGVE